MSLKNFRSFNLAVEFHKLSQQVRCAYQLRDQLTRASSSIALNLAEGSSKPTAKDRGRFYFIALGSCRECHAVLILLGYEERSELMELVNKLEAHIIKLCAKDRAFPKIENT